MKKLLFLSMLLFITGIQAMMGQNPIPSYNFPVSRQANFVEQRPILTTSDNSREKRQVIVKTTCVGSEISNCSATVWVYSLDGTTVYGPFTMYGGQTLRVDIDDREWGVYVTTDDQIVVDVWIE